LLCTFVVAAALVAPTVAQSTPDPFQATTPPAAPSQTPPPSRQGGAAPTARPNEPSRLHPLTPITNVRLELAITDTYAGAPARKVVTMLVANGTSSLVRTSNHLSDGYNVNLNVDAHVELMSNQAIYTSLTFQYTPAQVAGEGKPAPRPADLFETVS